MTDIKQSKAAAIYLLARLKRKLIAPRVVAVTGSSAKSTTTLLLGSILSSFAKVRVHAGYNNYPHVAKAMTELQRKDKIFIVEAAASEKSQLEKTAALLNPYISVVTMVALEHRSYFRTLDAVAKEKGILVESIQSGGLGVLNADDPYVLEMRNRTNERVITYGRYHKQLDYRAREISAILPGMLTLRLDWKDQSILLRTKFPGEHFWVPTVAAAATALELGVPPSLVAERIANFVPLFERGGTLVIPGGPIFIVDTNKAPGHSVSLFFDAIAGARAPRRRIVLGHMSDLPRNNEKSYREAYRLARSRADQVIFVGKYIHRSKATDKEIREGAFVSFSTPEEAYEYIRKTTIPNEVILLKSNSDLHLERIALAFIRDIRCWEPSCGRKHGCLDCGVFHGSTDASVNYLNLARRQNCAQL